MKEEASVRTANEHPVNARAEELPSLGSNQIGNEQQVGETIKAEISTLSNQYNDDDSGDVIEALDPTASDDEKRQVRRRRNVDVELAPEVVESDLENTDLLQNIVVGLSVSSSSVAPSRSLPDLRSGGEERTNMVEGQQRSQNDIGLVGNTPQTTTIGLCQRYSGPMTNNDIDERSRLVGDAAADELLCAALNKPRHRLDNGVDLCVAEVTNFVALPVSARRRGVRRNQSVNEGRIGRSVADEHRGRRLSCNGDEPMSYLLNDRKLLANGPNSPSPGCSEGKEDRNKQRTSSSIP